MKEKQIQNNFYNGFPSFGVVTEKEATRLSDQFIRSSNSSNKGSIPRSLKHFQIHKKQIGLSELYKEQENLKRSKSAKVIDVLKKSRIDYVENTTTEQLKDSIIKLRTEQIYFKLKTKVGTLLKQINASIMDLNRFSSVSKIDEIIDFLSQVIKKKIINIQITQETHQKSSVRDKQAYQLCQKEINEKNIKINEKETAQKQFKQKIKDLNAQIKRYIDKIAIKQKQISESSTENYHLKIHIQQKEKLFDSLQKKQVFVQKDSIMIVEKYQLQIQKFNKKMEKVEQQIQEKNQEITALQQEIEFLQKKEKGITQINSHLEEEIMRWRQRFETNETRESSNKQSLQNAETPRSQNKPDGGYIRHKLKKSTMSMQNYGYQNQNSLQFENFKLIEMIKELQIKNEEFRKQLNVNQSSSFHRQSQLSQLGIVDQKKMAYLKQNHKKLYDQQIDNQYKKKLEKIATEWKQKLLNVIMKNQQQMQEVKKEVEEQREKKEKLAIQLKEIAKSKYLVENRLLELEKQISNVKDMVQQDQPKEMQ